MIEIGRLCVKVAGRDSNKKCVIVDILEGNLVLIDGETRRRKCNISHLEPLDLIVEIKKGASHEEVFKEFENLGLKPLNTKPKDKKEKPIKIRKSLAKVKTPKKEKKEKKAFLKSEKKENKALTKVKKKALKTE